MNNINNNNRGQVGIGTLIVFIAMVLVAAIAAGVLVNTAGMLQETAEQTGQESQAQVSDRVIELQTYAVIGDDGGSPAVAQADSMSFMISPSAGSDDIAVRSITLSWVGPDGADQVQLYDDVTDAWATGVTFTAIPSSENDVLKSGEKAVITLDLTADIGGESLVNQLQAGEEAMITLTTASGASTEIRVTMPSVMTSGETIEL